MFPKSLFVNESSMRYHVPNILVQENAHYHRFYNGVFSEQQQVTIYPVL